MFAPSFVTGRLMKRFGVLQIMFTGALLNFAALAVALAAGATLGEAQVAVASEVALAYIALRDASPCWVRALMAPDAMTIPAREVADGARAVQFPRRDRSHGDDV